MNKIRYFILSILVCGFIHLQAQVVHDISITSSAFPSISTINVGDTVRWTNNHSIAHNVTANDGTWASPTLFTGDEYKHAFDEEGTEDYNCTFHNGMNGSITVAVLGNKNNSAYAKTFNLYPVYPNPFNPSATITWAQPKAENVNINIFNLKGELANEFSFTKSQPGFNSFSWHPENLPAGIYLIRLTGETFTVTQKAIYLK